MSTPQTKTCPDCAEEIKAEARVCRYCGYRFDRTTPEAAEADATNVDVTEPALRPEPATPTVARSMPASKRGWPRDLGYAVAILIWILITIPLWGQLADPPRDGAEIASAALVAIALPAALAAGIRLAYAKLRKRRFWSPWLFIIAALVALVSTAGQMQQEEDGVNTEAVERGVAEKAEDMTPVQRCVTRALEDLDTVSPKQRALIPGDERSFLVRVCSAAEREGTLTASGDIYASDAFQIAVCTEGILIEFDKIPRSQRAFTRADFAVFGERYCERALKRGFNANTSRREREGLQDAVLKKLLASGQIERIR